MLKKSNKTVLKDTYEVLAKQDCFYTGGSVHLTSDSSALMTTCRDAVKVINTKTGLVERTICEEDDPAVTCFVVSPNDNVLIVSSENLILRIWDWKIGTSSRTWKSIHQGPILEMAIDDSSTLLATGGSDSTIKIWDLEQRYYTHNLKGHKGIITALKFRNSVDDITLISSSMDLIIKVWDLERSVCKYSLEGHYSAVTCLVLDPNNRNTLISSGRDSVLLVWDLESRSRTTTLPVFEAVESIQPITFTEKCEELGVTSPDHLHIITGGNRGMLRIWDMVRKKCVYTQTVPGVTNSKQNDGETNERSITKLINTKNQICVVNQEHNIQFYNTTNMVLEKQYIGHNDEIMDCTLFGRNEEYLAVATNSTSIKVYQRHNFDSDLLFGHTDLVMTLSVSSDGQLLFSGSKDNTAILWRLGESIHDIQMLYKSEGHTQSVSATAISRLSPIFMVTGSVDTTLKLWKSTSDLLTEKPNTIRCIKTTQAHERDINHIDISPNNKLIVTASRDKTAKIWTSDALSLVGTLSGHRRGLWKAKFSPIDQCIITASGDGTLKIFSLSNMSCVKTFEGHESPVLNVCFATRGMQLLSTDDSGMLKLWTIKDNENVATFESHTERCWALCTSSNNEDIVITGAADSSLTIWKDVTQEKIVKETRTIEKQQKQQQQLSNLLHEKRYHEALSLALTMEKPYNSFNIIKAILKSEGEERLFETTQKLNTSQIDVLLRFCVEWNTNSRTCHEAQLLINQILRMHSPDDLLDLPNIKHVLEALIPYTERHYDRMSRLVQSTQFIDYTWTCMKLSDQKLSTDDDDS